MLHPDVASQIDAVPVDPARPLVVCDADEVLFDFMSGFEAFLGAEGVYFTWREYRLNGNLLHRPDDSPLAADQVRGAVERYFARHTETMAAIDGAAEGLARLARRTQVVVLSNLPLACRDARCRALARLGTDLPLVANLGAKGPAVAALACRAGAPVFFIDDSPTHHADVATHAAAVTRIHFVGHARLSGLIGPAPDSHARAEAWPDIVGLIERALGPEGP
ncbi:MAG: hypothetical protein FJX36_05570 [Alphaproteobacteria bacterium]|nr:hypothetical protein [Alphaproteobacteria bacterium]